MCHKYGCFIKRPELSAPLGVASGLANKNKLWPVGKSLTWSLLLPQNPEYIGFVARAFDIWSSHANLSFKYVDDWHSADVRIQLDPFGGNWSYVGTDILTQHHTAPTMNLGEIEHDFARDNLGTVLHEIGHTIGLEHEHQSPFDVIKWIPDAVYKKYPYWSKEQCDYQVINAKSRDDVTGTRRDKTSIMHYPIDGSLTVDGVSTPWNTELSHLDKVFIQTLYPFEKRVDAEVEAFIRKLYGDWSQTKRMPKKHVVATLDELAVEYDKRSDRFALRRLLHNHLKLTS